VVKNRKFCPPPLIYRPRSGWPPSNLWKSFTVPETRVFQAADGEDLVIVACTVFDWSTRVTDRRTDGRTDGIAMAKTRVKSEPKLLGLLPPLIWQRRPVLLLLMFFRLQKQQQQQHLLLLLAYYLLQSSGSGSLRCGQAQGWLDGWGCCWSSDERSAQRLSTSLVATELCLGEHERWSISTVRTLQWSTNQSTRLSSLA